MYFRFDVFLTDEDYMDFNTFILLNSEQNIKNYRKLSIFCVIIFLISGIVAVVNTGSLLAFVGVLPFAVAGVFGVKPFIVNFTKRQIKANLKKGKKPYSPEAVMEFFDEWFSETTPENATQQKYNAIEKIWVSEKGTVYIFINNYQAYNIPYRTFHAPEEFDCFMNFMHTKCADIKFY